MDEIAPPTPEPQPIEAVDVPPPQEPPPLPAREESEVPVSDGPGLGEVFAAVSTLSQNMDTFTHETAAHYKNAFDKLYEEMRQYKDNFAFELKRELLNEILMLYDSIGKVRHFYASADGADKNHVANLDNLLIEAEEIFARRNIELIIDTAERFDARTQKAVRSVPTPEESENLLVAQKLKNGFMLGDRPFRKEEVVIKKYTPATSAPSAPQGQPESTNAL